MRPLPLVLVLLVPLVAGCLADDPLEDAPAADPGPADENAGVPAAAYPQDAALAATGRWDEPFEGEVAAVSMALLADGRVIYWSGVEGTENASVEDATFFTAPAEAARARILDLSGAAPAIAPAEQPDDLDLFCAGLTMLPDGRLLTAGGTAYTVVTDLETGILDGERRTRVFDPATSTWSEGPDMLLGRWYPSVLTLPDGTPVAASGIGKLTDPTTHWETWEALRGDAWEGAAGSAHDLPLYPRLFVLPGGAHKGEVYYTTSATLWGPFGEHHEEASWSIQAAYDPTAGAWTDFGPSTFGARQYASSIMLPVGPDDGYAPEFLNFGGTLQRGTVATPLVERTDLSGDAPVNSIAAPMVHPRWHHNGVLLPDGTVLAVGGGLIDNVVLHGQENPPVLPAETFDPGTGSWTELAAMQVPRMYHSTALLLPDGRVLAGGHVPLPNPFTTARDTVNPQVVETRLEVFEPPYLFRADRPHITEAPTEIAHGELFEVRVDAPAGITGAMLMRPGTTTHAYDTGQRAVELEIVASEEGRLTLRAPPDAIVMPPGPMMLFVQAPHEDGPTPSTAAWVRLDG